ncbi:hypothetical protein [Nocardia sp. NPDC051570]|uniref:hypothetical protein n=1 Tax=Nocardia sp. NPDC051570 TaxID=3364324 RepID=UPI0037881A29
MFESNRAAAAVATLGALAASIAFAAPQAGAAVTSIHVESGQSFGSSADTRGTGCSYPVTVTTEPGREVFFIDQIGDDRATADYRQFHPADVLADASGTARTTWTPDRKGQHKLVVVEVLSDDDFDAYSLHTPLTVGTGITLGPACAVLP